MAGNLGSYSSYYSYDNINLDIEFKRFVLEYGWWTVVRSFDISRRSQYWNEKSQEAIGGPPWRYNDIIFKARRVEKSALNAEDFFTRQQFTEVFDAIFFVISNIRIKKEDRILEIPQDLRFLPTPPRRVKCIEQFDIKHVEYKIDRGLAFNKCYVTKMTPTNDETLLGSIPVHYVNIGNV